MWKEGDIKSVACDLWANVERVKSNRRCKAQSAFARGVAESAYFVTL